MLSRFLDLSKLDLGLNHSALSNMLVSVKYFVNLTKFHYASAYLYTGNYALIFIYRQLRTYILIFT